MKKIDEDKLNAVLQYIDTFALDNGYPPSVREIGKDLGIKSTATVFSYIERLQSRGLLSKSPDKNRAIGLVKGRGAKIISAPLIGKVTAGTPILAVENFEEFYPISSEFGNGELFLLRVSGESMINSGIYDGDKLIVRKQNSAINGEIVVALIEDSATVKRFFARNGKYILHPENDTMSDIVLDSVEILGIVEGLIRKF